MIKKGDAGGISFLMWKNFCEMSEQKNSLPEIRQGVLLIGKFYFLFL